MTPQTCLPLEGLPATGSVRYSMADSSVAVAFFEVVVDFAISRWPPLALVGA